MYKLVERDDALNAAAWGHRIIAVDIDNNINVSLLDMVPEKYIYLDLDADDPMPEPMRTTLQELQKQEEEAEQSDVLSPVIKIPEETKATKFDIDLEELKEQLKKGISIKRIAENFKCSDQTIYNLMHRHGIAHNGYPEGIKK